MNIAIIGATGFVGQHLVTEALQRGHEVKAIARNVAQLTAGNGLTPVQADITDVPALAAALKGSDIVLSAFNAGWQNPELYNDFMAGSKAIQQAVKEAGVQRLIVVGGAGSLYIAPGLQLVDSPDFPEAYKAGATAARDYLDLLKQEPVIDWTFFSPAIEMHPGITTGRTGQYRTALDSPVFDAAQHSRLSVEDLAVALLDETETPKHSRQRFTAAY